MLPLIGRVSLGVGAISYAGQFNITAVADGDAYPDIDIFAASVRDESRALAESIRVKSGRADGHTKCESSGAMTSRDSSRRLFP